MPKKGPITGKKGRNFAISRIGMRPLVTVKKSAKLKSALVAIPISPKDFIISYCHVNIKRGASISKRLKVVDSALYC